MTRLALALLLLLPAAARADDLRLNQIQVIGTHNSYKQPMTPELFAALKAISPLLSQPFEYWHEPLTERLLGQPIEPAEVFDNLPGGHAVVDAGVGRHEANLSPHLVGLCQHVAAIDACRSAGWAEDRAAASAREKIAIYATARGR